VAAGMMVRMVTAGEHRGCQPTSTESTLSNSRKRALRLQIADFRMQIELLSAIPQSAIPQSAIPQFAIHQFAICNPAICNSICNLQSAINNLQFQYL
jgi:hypothetical protein